MKTSKNLTVIAIIVSVFMLQGCLSIFSGSRFKIERDNILGTTRIRVNMDFKKAEEIRTSFVKLQKTFTKEKNSNSVITYQVFDVLDLDRASFGLRNEMAIIIDNVPYVIFPEIFETTLIGAQANGSPQGTTDQFPQGVFEHRTFRLNYFLENSIIENLRFSNIVYFRYYSGPEVITVKLTRSDMRNLKRMIDQAI
jgi:hypothetical protein